MSGQTAASGAAEAMVALGSDGAAALGGAAIITTLAQLILTAGVYVWLALALTAVFRKTGQPAWRAWVPVLNIWTLFELAGMKGWWAAVQAAGAVVVVVVGAFVTAAASAAVIEAGFSGTGAEGAVLGATVTLIALWVVYLALVMVLQVRMLRALNRGFGLGVGHTVLGVVLLPLWASLVGWGSPQWRGSAAAVGGLPPTPFAPPTAASEDQPAQPPAPAAAFAPPAPGPAAPLSPGIAPAAPAVPVGGNPWMPPPTSPAADASRPAPAARANRTAEAPVAPASAPEAAPAEDAVEEHTVLAAHRRLSTTLTLPGGVRVSLRGDLAVLGRNPVAPDHAPTAQRVPIDDVTRTVSKTHALLRRDGDRWTITDLASTNGVFVGTADAETEATSPTVVSGRFLLGDAELHLTDNG